MVLPVEVNNKHRTNLNPPTWGRLGKNFSIEVKSM
jgi:hypothetical protein